MKLVFIAGPFRGKDSWIVAENVRRAEQLGYEVAKRGAMPLIPHANTAHFNGTMTDQFWLEGTQELLTRCDALVVLPLWEQSVGPKMK